MNGAARSPAALARRLAELVVRVDEVAHSATLVDAAGYPGGGRPSLEIRLGGGGAWGRGEHVGWSLEGAEEVARLVAGALGGGRGTVGALAARVASAHPYTRAAVEGALIDLALAQSGKSLAALMGMGTAAVALRYLISFDATLDAAARLGAIRAKNPVARFKIDAHPEWSDEALARLAETNAVAVVDFKERGDAALVERVASRLPSALIEDPPASASGAIAHRTARDMPLVDALAVERAVAAGEAVNLKAPRMGGWFALLAGLDRALAVSARVYFGGMFEVGVGRSQAQALAALFAPDAEHDLAPIPARDDDARPPSPLAIRLDKPGFG